MRFLPLLTLATTLIAAPAFAQDSLANGSAAGSAVSEVAAHLTASGVQTAVGVSAVPASVAGVASVAGGASVAGAGSAVSAAAGASADVASGGPLKVDDRVVVSPDPAPAVPYDTQKAKPK
jgi:hypothetical protein